MKSRRGIWVDFKGPENDNKLKVKDPEFEGVINEVISGSLFTIRNTKTKEDFRISLTNIKAPKCSKKFEKE